MNFTNMIKSIKKSFSNLLFPNHIKCIFCKDELIKQNQYDCCDDCFKALPRINSNFCLRCGAKQNENSVGVCQNCKRNNFSFELARSPFSYEGNIRKTIYAFKYDNAKYLANPLSTFLYECYKDFNINVDFVTSVPLHLERIKSRGYNQASELAKEFCLRTSLNFIEIFSRIKNTPSQTELNVKDRHSNVKNAFALNKNIDIKDKNILIIDDIFTTGATVNELASLLKNNGAKNVYILTLAHTQLKETL